MNWKIIPAHSIRISLWLSFHIICLLQTNHKTSIKQFCTLKVFILLVCLPQRWTDDNLDVTRWSSDLLQSMSCSNSYSYLRRIKARLILLKGMTYLIFHIKIGTNQLYAVHLVFLEWFNETIKSESKQFYRSYHIKNTTHFANCIQIE